MGRRVRCDNMAGIRGVTTVHERTGGAEPVRRSQARVRRAEAGVEWALTMRVSAEMSDGGAIVEDELAALRPLHHVLHTVASQHASLEDTCTGQF